MQPAKSQMSVVTSSFLPWQQLNGVACETKLVFESYINYSHIIWGSLRLAPCNILVYTVQSNGVRIVQKMNSYKMESFNNHLLT